VVGILCLSKGIDSKETMGAIASTVKYLCPTVCLPHIW